MINKDNWDRQSITTLNSMREQQLAANADAFGSLPNDTICGQIEINDSSGNHIDTKILATPLTVINNNTSTTESTANTNEAIVMETISVIRTSRFSKLIIFSLITIIALTVAKFYDFNLFGKTKIQLQYLNKVIESTTVLPITEVPRLPEPWLVSQEQWGASISQSRCNIVYGAISVAIGDTKTNTCNNITSCSKIIREIQSNKMMNLTESKCDIDYNFLIGHDGRIYEGLGWNTSKIVLMIYGVIKVAFIGDYSSTSQNHSLSDMHVFSLMKFLEKSLKERHLRNGYTIVPECCTDAVVSPGDNIFVSMISWELTTTSFNCVILDSHNSCRHLFYYYSHYNLYKYPIH